MKALKSIGQVLSAVVYTCLFTGLLYLILVLPFGWLISLKTKTMILALIFLGGIIQALIVGAQVLLMMPYAWIVKNNIVALVISVGLMIFNLTFNDIQVWRNSLDHGTTGIIIAVIITLMIVEALIFSIIGIISSYTEQ